MKRVYAAIIDYVTFFCVGGIIFNNVYDIVKSFKIYLMIIVLLFFLYFFFQDFFFQGISFGKRIVWLKLRFREKTIGTAIKHSLFKILACMLWPVTLMYYIAKHRMFYDKIIGIEEV
ncbi:hypothetical protein [Lacrimispora sp.]|uniref:hypothetical protein n=1 Tax=Lacrimispora sp. TaxID=2719234 RepID=UPI00130E4601|nr:hypothetical protein [Lacrimispora sp.]MDR7810489.1 hypothetical protein [Lacrimispora sp.]